MTSCWILSGGNLLRTCPSSKLILRVEVSLLLSSYVVLGWQPSPADFVVVIAWKRKSVFENCDPSDIWAWLLGLTIEPFSCLRTVPWRSKGERHWCHGFVSRAYVSLFYFIYHTVGLKQDTCFDLICKFCVAEVSDSSIVLLSPPAVGGFACQSCAWILARVGVLFSG